MNNHLSSEQVSRYVIGDSTPEERRHIRECKECGAEAERVRTVLASFRSSVWSWAGQQQKTKDAIVKLRRPQLRRRWLRWAPILAVVAALAVLPVYKNLADREREAQAAQDAALLEQVNSQLLRSAPASLEPLMDLLSDTSGQKEGESR